MYLYCLNVTLLYVKDEKNVDSINLLCVSYICCFTIEGPLYTRIQTPNYLSSVLLSIHAYLYEGKSMGGLKFPVFAREGIHL